VKLKKEFDRNYEDKLFKSRKGNLPQDNQSNPDKMKLSMCSSDFVQTSLHFTEQLRKYTEKAVSSKEYVLGLERDVEFLLSRDMHNPNFYILTETQFANKELNNPFTQRFILDMEKVLTLYRKYLTKFNFEELLDLAMVILCEKMEGMIIHRKVNHLGGLQLDKDVREFMDYFGTKTDRTVRDKFSRLTQIAYLLKMNEVDDILEIWESAQHWRLSISEIKNVLSLRVEFKMDQINNLSI